uniref:Uncharacterized protein n=1 Tax=Anguilla anguilla TaxID=7936 RepID=A0A0E9W9T6_ANGAN
MSQWPACHGRGRTQAVRRASVQSLLHSPQSLKACLLFPTKINHMR